MTDPVPVTQEDREVADPVVALLPCPFCGEALFHNGNKMNAYGRCETDGCWMHERKCTVPIDDARQVAAWNTRPPAPAVGEVRVVPVEPTDEMLAAAARELSAQSTYLGWDPSSVWSAMLAATPEPAKTSGAGEGGLRGTDDDIGLLEAARDLLAARERLGYASHDRLDLWEVLRLNVERLS